MGKRFILILLVCLLATVSCTGQTASKNAENKKADSLKVLFIGNSYTYFNNLPQILEKMAAGRGEKLEAEMVVAGGATLRSLWNREQTVRTIRGKKWDFVVLQEQSTLGNGFLIGREGQKADPTNFYKYARLFDEEIKKSGAKTVFFLTWARENARPAEQEVLNNAYLSIGKELNALVAPVGIVWQKVRCENKNLKLYIPDGSHPNANGSYLAASVFYATFFQKNPTGLARQINGNTINLSRQKSPSETRIVDLSEDDAGLIQKTVWEVYRARNNK